LRPFLLVEMMVTEKDDKPLTGLKKAESIAKIISVIALPLIVAVGGWYIQSSMNKNAVKSQYVEIAVGILSQPPDESNVTLRDWASKTLAEHSTIEFTRTEIESLVTGDVQITDYKSARSEERYFEELILHLTATQQSLAAELEQLSERKQELDDVRAKIENPKEQSELLAK